MVRSTAANPGGRASCIIRHPARLTLAAAICVLALSPEAAWIPPGPAGGMPADSLLSQRPAEIPPDAWQRILGR